MPRDPEQCAKDVPLLGSKGQIVPFILLILEGRTQNIQSGLLRI